jgi:hypothetical protein
MKYLIIILIIAIGYIYITQTNQKSNKSYATITPNIALSTKIIFPTIEAKTLSGQSIIFPTETLGKKTVLVIAFEQQAQPQADSWATRILADFHKEQVNYYEIPMLSSGYNLVRPFIDGGMKQGTDKDLHNKVATYYGELKEYKSQLNIENDRIAHLFLLNKKGEIIFNTNGGATKEKIQILYSLINN